MTKQLQRTGGYWTFDELPLTPIRLRSDEWMNRQTAAFKLIAALNPGDLVTITLPDRDPVVCMVNDKRDTFTEAYLMVHGPHLHLRIETGPLASGKVALKITRRIPAIQHEDAVVGRLLEGFQRAEYVQRAVHPNWPRHDLNAESVCERFAATARFLIPQARETNPRWTILQAGIDLHSALAGHNNFALRDVRRTVSNALFLGAQNAIRASRSS